MPMGRDPSDVVDDLVDATDGWTLAEIQNMACVAVLDTIDQDAPRT